MRDKDKVVHFIDNRADAKVACNAIKAIAVIGVDIELESAGYA